MQFILGFLGTVVTILWLLHRLAQMGIDLGGLNPFLWRRRKNWRNKYEANPIYQLQRPIEVTALLLTATAKADGDMSLEEKQAILHIFESEFQLSSNDATSLLGASSHILGNGQELKENLDKVLAPSLENFSEEQVQSAVDMIDHVARLGGRPSESQANILRNAKEILLRAVAPKAKWD